MAKILHTVSINSAAENVFAALTTQEGLSNWWTQKVRAKPETGALLEFDFEDEVCVMKLEPNTQVEWSCVDGPEPWLSTTVIFHIIDRGEQTLLHFDQHGWADATDFFRYCNLRWGTYLLSLKWYLETGAGRPFPNHIRL